MKKKYKIKIFRCEVISMYVEIDTFFGLSQVAITSKFEEFSIFAPSSISRFFFKYSTTKVRLVMKNSLCDDRLNCISSVLKPVCPSPELSSQMKLIAKENYNATWRNEENHLKYQRT